MIRLKVQGERTKAEREKGGGAICPSFREKKEKEIPIGSFIPLERGKETSSLFIGGKEEKVNP